MPIKYTTMLYDERVQEFPKAAEPVEDALADHLDSAIEAMGEALDEWADTQYDEAWDEALIEDAEKFPIPGQTAITDAEVFGKPDAVEEVVPIDTKSADPSPVEDEGDPMEVFISEVKSLGELHSLGVLDDEEFVWAKQVSKDKLKAAQTNREASRV
jgi:hypothetical protein